MAESVNVRINGKSASVSPGTSVAAAVMNSGRSSFRRSVGSEMRGPVCGMGICYECRATIDGVMHQRSCMIVCAEGMEIQTDG